MCSGLHRFEDYFSNRVKQLTYTFPEDAETSTGAPFWSAPKRFPRALQFSATDPGHLHFVMAASILRAETFGIPIPDWVRNSKKLSEAVEKVEVPDFQPKKDAKIVTDDKATNLTPQSIDDAQVINELIIKLEQCREKLPPGFRMKPIQFEKVLCNFRASFLVYPLYSVLCELINLGDSDYRVKVICMKIPYQLDGLTRQ